MKSQTGNLRKLKTLKDLRTLDLDSETELKAEAVKWVKKYKNSKAKLHFYGDIKVAEAFMEFFNITEEDLK